jgi:hypothetical protein
MKMKLVLVLVRLVDDTSMLLPPVVWVQRALVLEKPVLV